MFPYISSTPTVPRVVISEINAGFLQTTALPEADERLLSLIRIIFALSDFASNAKLWLLTVTVSKVMLSEDITRGIPVLSLIRIFLRIVVPASELRVKLVYSLFPPCNSKLLMLGTSRLNLVPSIVSEISITRLSAPDLRISEATFCVSSAAIALSSASSVTSGFSF